MVERQPAPELRTEPAREEPSRGRSRGWAFGAAALAGTIGVGALLVARDRNPHATSAAESVSSTVAPPAPASAWTMAPPSALPSAPSALSSTSPSAVAPPPDALAKTSADAPPARSSAKPQTPALALAGAGTTQPSQRRFPVNLVTACWRDTEGATATEGSSARVEIDLTPAGKVTAVRVQVPSNRFRGFRGCVMTRVSQTIYGPGPRETLFSSFGLPRSTTVAAP